MSKQQAKSHRTPEIGHQWLKDWTEFSEIDNWGLGCGAHSLDSGQLAPDAITPA
jgi:hypothetical protein